MVIPDRDDDISTKSAVSHTAILDLILGQKISLTKCWKQLKMVHLSPTVPDFDQLRFKNLYVGVVSNSLFHFMSSELIGLIEAISAQAQRLRHPPSIQVLILILYKGKLEISNFRAVQV